MLLPCVLSLNMFFVGGVVEGVVYANTFKMDVASVAGSVTENIINEGEDYLTGKKD